MRIFRGKQSQQFEKKNAMYGPFLYLYKYSTVLTFPEKYLPGTLYHDSYHTSTYACGSATTKLETDPRHVLRSLGQDSGPAARTATTHTARGGARRHGGIRAAPYTTMRCAAGTGRACTAAAAATGKESKRSTPAIPSYHTVFCLHVVFPSLIG